MQYKNKKNLPKILFITILLGFIISLVGCNWFSLGLLNIFDPQAQIRVNYTEINIGDGIITLEVYSLNRVEFIGAGFSYDYYIGTTLIPELSKTVGATFYVEPSDTPGIPGPITIIDNLPIYFKEAQDYLTANPLITEINCTINLIGTDGSGHDITISVTFGLPALQPGTPSAMTLQASPATIPAAEGDSIITATVKDAAGSLVPDGTAVTFTTTFGTLSSTYETTVDGIAITTLTSPDFAGSATVTATCGSVISTVVVTCEVTSGVVSTITLQAAPIIVTETAGSSTITATVKDANGNPVADGTPVTFSTTFGTLFSSYETTLDGVVTTILTFSTGDSSSVVTATSGSVSAIIAVYYLATSGVVSTIALVASPETIPVAAGTSTIVATVTDAAGNPVPDETAVTFITTFGTLSSSYETTLNGIATTVLTSGSVSPSTNLATVTAASGSVSDTVVVTCTVP